MSKLFPAVVLLSSMQAAAAIAVPAFVNATSGIVAASSTTLSATAVSHTAGNFLVVFARMGGLPGTCSTHSLSDTAGNTYSELPALYDAVIGCKTMFYSPNIKGNASNVVTLTVGSANTSMGIVVFQFSGMTGYAPLDTSITAATSSSGTVTSGTFSTTSPRDVIVAGATKNGNGFTWTAGAIGGTTAAIGSLDGTASTNDAAFEYVITSAKQSGITASITVSPVSGTYTVFMYEAAFRAAQTMPPAIY